MPDRPLTAAIPSGPERTVIFFGSASIAGAPVAYAIVLSAVVTALSFIPFSVVLSAGSSFPMAQGIYPLMGWLLGPWAGAVASGVGAIVGVFLAPHTAGIPWLTVAGATMGALCAGAMVPGRRFWKLGVGLSVVAVLAPLFYGDRAIDRNGVSLRLFLLAYPTHFFAIALFLLPTRRWTGRLVGSPDLKRVAIGLFLGTWSAAGVMMMTESAISYFLLNWPGELFIMFAAAVPVEHTMRSGIGAVVGTGVIAGLRAMSLVKPRDAVY